MMRWSLAVGLLAALIFVSGCATPGTPSSAFPATATMVPASSTASPSQPPLVEPTAQQGSAEPMILPSATSPPFAETDTLLMKLVRHGGLCASGSECQWQMTIYQSGAYTIGNEMGMVSEGVLSAEQMAELRGLIEQTGFAAIRAVPFTELCPTAYDGQESIYTFNTSYGEEVLSSCEVQIDMTLPLFQWIEELIAELTT